MRKKAKAKSMYKILNKMEPESHTNLFTHISKVANIRAFSAACFFTTSQKTNFEDGFTYASAQLWIVGEIKVQ